MNPTQNQNLGGFQGTGQTGTFGNVQYFAPNAQNPYGSYSPLPGTAGILPTTGGVPTLNTTTLTGNGTPPALPQTQPQTTPQQFVGSIPSAPLNLAPVGAGVGQQEQSVSAAQKRLLELQGKLTGQSAEQQRLEQAQGIPGLNKQVTELTKKLNQQKAAFDAQANAISATAGTQEGLIGATSRLRREEAISVGITGAALQAAQGNLQGAREEVDRTLKFEFEPIKQELENTKTFLEMNYKNLDRADKLRADALSRQNQRDMVALNAFYDIKKSAINEAIKSNPALASQYASAKSLEDFANINAQAFNTATTTSAKVESLNSTLDLLNQIQKSSGLNTRVGPTGVARRFLGVGDMFGAGQAFAGSVHQLTSQETLNALINLKAAGGTLGALSDQERVMLQNAATKINAWEKKDKQGIGKGVWNISEKTFNDEVNRLKQLTKTAIERAGGSTTLTSSDYLQVQQLMQAPENFNPAAFY